MAGTYSILGTPVSILGVSYLPAQLLPSGDHFAWEATGDVLPTALPTAALTVMVANGAATMCG